MSSNLIFAALALGVIAWGVAKVISLVRGPVIIERPSRAAPEELAPVEWVKPFVEVDEIDCKPLPLGVVTWVTMEEFRSAEREKDGT